MTNINALPADIKGRLRRSAVAMRGEQRSLPVLLRDICAALRIRIHRQPIVPPGKAFLAWDRQRDPAPTILLPVNPHKTWDRFCAAHELGHYVLISEYGWIPQQREDYWRTEDLCDDFARELLLPDELLSTVGESSAGPVDYLNMCDRISRTALVPWKQVAAKVTDSYPVYFFVIDKTADDCLKISSSTFPGGKGRVDVPADTLLATRVKEARQKSVDRGATLDVRISRSTFRGTKLEPLIRKSHADNVVVRVSPYSEQAKFAAIP